MRRQPRPVFPQGIALTLLIGFASLAGGAVNAAAGEQDFVDLIDRSLTGWKTTGDWSVDEQNVLHLAPKSKSFRLFPDVKQFLWLRQPQSDFVLDMEYRLAEESRSGVFIRTTSLTKHMEIQLCNPPITTGSTADSSPPLTDEDCGALVDYAPPTCVASKPAGQWNSLRIDCQGDRLNVQINDVTVLDFDLSRHERLRTMDQGMIALQNQSTAVSFRNVRLRSIESPTTR